MNQLSLVHTVPLIYLHLVSVLYCHLGLGDVMRVFNKVLRRVYCVVRHCYFPLWYYVCRENADGMFAWNSLNLPELCFQLLEYPLKICRNSLPDLVSSYCYPLWHCPSEALRYRMTEHVRCEFEKFCKDSSIDWTNIVTALLGGA